MGLFEKVFNQNLKKYNKVYSFKKAREILEKPGNENLVAVPVPMGDGSSFKFRIENTLTKEYREEVKVETDQYRNNKQKEFLDGIHVEMNAKGYNDNSKNYGEGYWKNKDKSGKDNRGFSR